MSCHGSPESFVVTSIRKCEHGDTQLYTDHLQQAANRVTAIARAHDLLYQGSDVEWLDLGKYIESVSKDLDASIAQCDIHCSVDVGIEIATDQAISAALIVNELVTNACKYAYPGKSGDVWVTLSRVEESGFSISVRDQGIGFSADIEPGKDWECGWSTPSLSSWGEPFKLRIKAQEQSLL
jgi:two-component sensor histidine kinase